MSSSLDLSISDCRSAVEGTRHSGSICFYGWVQDNYTRFGHLIDIGRVVLLLLSPLAASLAQGHRTQSSSGGENVAFKVQRPSLKRLFLIDLGISGRIAELVQHQALLGEGGRDWSKTCGEHRCPLWEDINYRGGGRNAKIVFQSQRNLSYRAFFSSLFMLPSCYI